MTEKRKWKLNAQHHGQADDLWARFEVPEWGVFCHTARLLQLIAGAAQPQHCTFLMLEDSTTMRLAEAINLRACHIDSKPMQIRAVAGKGTKDRYTVLAPAMLIELRVHILNKLYIYRSQLKGDFEHKVNAMNKATENLIKNYD